jgi:hypothetical protein
MKSNLKIKIFWGNKYLKYDPFFSEKFDKIRKVMHLIFKEKFLLQKI